MNDKKHDITIAFIGGGSMGFGSGFISEICREPKLSGTVRLYDVDKKLSLANELLGNTLRETAEAKTSMIFLAADTLDEALRNADFVVISIDTGDTDELVSDIEIPSRYGIIQAIGDNTGPGGIMRALRTLPYFIDIANKIKELCPDAWVVSLTQPMSACVDVMNRVFPEIKLFGSSNEIFAAQDLIAEFTSQATGDDSITRRDIKTSPIGINRFVWFNEISYEGMDLFDIYAAFAKKYSDDGYERARKDNKPGVKMSAHKVKFDLFLRYGLIAATHDRGLADSCPPWYLSSARVANHFGLQISTPNAIKRARSEKSLRCRRILNGEHDIKVGWSGTDVITQIKALLGMSNSLSNVVMLNDGQVKNLPIGSAVETNALISRNSIKPVLAGNIPSDILPLVSRQVGNTDILVDAVLHKNLDYAFNVFINDPLVTLDLMKASELFREMLAANKRHLSFYLE